MIYQMSFNSTMRHKKILFFILIFCFITGICVAQNSPSDVVKKFYRSYYDRDASSLLDCITPEDKSFISGVFGEEGLTLFLNLFMGAFTGMTQEDLSILKNIKILSEKIDGDRATVKVAVDEAPSLNLVKIHGFWKIDMGLSYINDLFNF